MVSSKLIDLITLFIFFNQFNWMSCQSPFIVQQKFLPCPQTEAVIGETNVNGPPGKRNSWRGVIYLDDWPNLSRIELEILLDNDAKIRLRDKIGQIYPIQGGYKINIARSSSQIKRIHFNVDGKPNRGFPNLIAVYLNGIDICHPEETTEPFYDYGETLIDEKIDNPKSNCGMRKIIHQGLITNGYPSKEGDWPWHTGLFLRKNSSVFSFICSGSLISSTVVLTAAHCLIEGGTYVVPQRIFIKLGLHNRLLNSPNTKEHQVYSIVIHEKFNTSNLSNDLGLLKLSSRVIYSNYIQPICLWPQKDKDLSTVVNRYGTVVGWGLNENDKLSDILTQGTMPVVSLTECLQSNRDFFGLFLTDQNYCAGFRNGTSVCNGDSGGGMVFEKNNIYYIRGIVSLAVALPDRDVCNPKEYVIFTDVAKYLNWIENNWD